MLSGHVLGPELQSLVECTESGGDQDYDYSSQVMWTTPSTPSDEGEKLLLSFLNEIESTDMTQLLRLGGDPQPSPRVDTIHKPQTTKTKKGKQKLTWLRRKESLAALRQESAELTTQLTELERRRALQPDKWKAGLERNRLQKALTDRIYLKARLRVLKRVAESQEKILEELLSTRQLQRLCHLSASRSLHKELRVGRKVQLNAAWIFDALEETLNSKCGAVVTALSTASPTDGDRDVDTVEVLNPSDGQFAIKFTRECTISSSEEDVWKALWEVFSFGVKTDAEVAWRSTDTMTKKVFLPVKLRNGIVVTGGNHLVMKAFTIPGGFVALQETTVEWSVDMGHSKVWRHVTNNSCAISVQRIQQPNAATTTDSGHRTKVSSSFDVHPGGSSCGGGGSSHVEADFLIPSIQTVMNSRLQTIQSMV